MRIDDYEKYIFANNVMDLRNAIVKQACTDYVKTGMYIKRFPEAKNSKAIWLHESVKKWFLSDRFNSLETNHTGEWFIKQLDMQIDYLWKKKIKNTREFTKAVEIEKYGESEYKEIRHKYKYKINNIEED